MSNQDTILATVQAYFDRIQAMDSEGWQQLFAADGVVYDPVGNPPQSAQQTANQFFELLTVAFNSIAIVPNHIFVAGSAAAVKWTMQVVGKQGKQGEAEGISTFALDETGKIREVSSYWDDAALMAQMRG